MRFRPPRLVIGVLVGLLYLGLAAITFRLDPLAGRPLLDGLGPPPAYRWVSPPPELAPGNVPPETADFTVGLDESGSQPGVFSSPDLQVSVAFGPGAFPAREGEEGVAVTITHLAPVDAGPPPSGLEIRGNVVRIEARYDPSGTRIEDLTEPTPIAMTYPAEPGSTFIEYTVLSSTDGRTWAPLETLSSPAQHRVGADITSMGYYAVAGPPTESGGGTPTLRIVVIAGGVLLAAGLAFFQWRRGAARKRALRQRAARKGSRAGSRKGRR
jgi:hypothetical protein